MLSRGRSLRISCLTRQWIGQVIAPLLIIKRVADRNTLIGNAVATGNTSSFKIGSQRESKGSGGSLPSDYPMDPVGKFGEGSGELGIRVETAIDFHRDDRV